ncbi:poly(A)-specific ribonuclease PARN-like protein, partial [Leptotrombidium deliense]
IEKAVEDCEFVSVDCELSGLHSNGCSLNLYDTIDERYQKLKKNALGYSVIQFGLSCFIRDTDSSGECKYNCRSFNFYIFPYKTSANVKRKDDSFLIQPSAFAFLSANGFDFNKLFRYGINWLSADEEDSLMEKQRPSNGKSYNDFSNVTINCNVGVPEEHKH